MSLLREVEWEPCLLERQPDPELTDELRKRHGAVSSSIAYFYPCRELADSLAGMGALHVTRATIDPLLQDMIGAVVSQDHSCRYCYAIQRVVLRAGGLSEERIRKLAEDVLTADLEPAQRAALEFARRVSRSNPLPTRAEARKLEEHGFSEMQVKEIAGVVGVSVFFNRLSTLPALPPAGNEELPDRWYARLFRPITGMMINRMRRQVPVTRLSDDERRGPYSQVICALDGLPVAVALRRCIDALLASDVLPLRTKALVFAVVGRALACDMSVQMGSELACEAGVDPAVVDEALAHLRGDGLTDAEKMLLPMARETVWYQPAPIQRRAREVRDALGPQRLIEFIVAASTANALCRIGAVVVDR